MTPAPDPPLLISTSSILQVIFFQPMVLSIFPSDAYLKLRPPYRIVTLIGCAVPIASASYACTTVWAGSSPGRPEILFGGVMPPAWVVTLGIGIWALGAVLFVRPLAAARDILLVGSVVLTLLAVVDGSVELISRMGTYCLLLSFVWILEPLWMGPGPALTTTTIYYGGLQRPFLEGGGGGDEPKAGAVPVGGPVALLP